MDWMQQVLFEYIIKNQIRTNSENIKAVCEYAIKQGYNESIDLFCDALLADSEMLAILERSVI
jgi:hypothetical protein